MGFEFGTNTGVSTEGTSAWLITRYGAVCDTNTSNGNFTTAWSMVQDRDGPCKYAQSGFMRWYGSNLVHFTEDNNGNCSLYTRTFGSTVAAGETHHYWVQSAYCNAPPTPCINENIDTTTIHTTLFNPYASWAQPWRSSWLGETKYLESNMPGSIAAPMTYTGMQWQDQSANWRNDLPGQGWVGHNDNPTKWGASSSIVNQSYSIWTKI